jgi:elongation factor P
VPDIQATGLRRGTTVILDGVPYKVLTHEHRTPGNKRGFVQTKLRNLLDGTQREVKFSAQDSVERAVIDSREMDYLYADGSGCVFMDVENYEQLTISDATLGDARPWLSDGMRIVVEVLDGNAIGVALPKVVEAVVQETEAVVKGQTAARSNKPATLENGVTLQVPPFINVGDRVRVDPVELRYVERAK